MEYDIHDYDDVSEEGLPIRYPRDVKIDEARTELERFFKENDENVYYMKQLEVFFERKFFHWITSKAVNELLAGGLLVAEEVPLLRATRAKFVFSRTHRFYKRQMKQHIEVVRDYSDPNIAIACGRQAEVLFFNALTNEGFLSRGQNVNEYCGKRWTRTNHDFDFILERDGIAYGSEVKNTWSYIDEEELNIKLGMCEFLGIRPLFIMRGAPKNYNWEIARRGGFALIFVAQIYPFGQKKLVDRVKEVLCLPADCPRAIPKGIIDRFLKWHMGQVRRGCECVR